MDEVINADESEEEDEIYSTVSKIEEKKVAKFHFKIQRRHTTYVKQFDSLPPQATLIGFKPNFFKGLPPQAAFIGSNPKFA